MSAVKSQSSLTEQSGMQAVDLTKLNLMQLTQFKQGLDTDLQFYQESLQNLKHAQSKYVKNPFTEHLFKSVFKIMPVSKAKYFLFPGFKSPGRVWRV